MTTAALGRRRETLSKTLAPHPVVAHEPAAGRERRKRGRRPAGRPRQRVQQLAAGRRIHGRAARAERQHAAGGAVAGAARHARQQRRARVQVAARPNGCQDRL